MVESRTFRITVRALHLFPGIAIVVGLLIGAASACQAIANYMDHPVIHLSASSAQQNGSR